MFLSGYPVFGRLKPWALVAKEQKEKKMIATCYKVRLMFKRDNASTLRIYST